MTPMTPFWLQSCARSAGMESGTPATGEEGTIGNRSPSAGSVASGLLSVGSVGADCNGGRTQSRRAAAAGSNAGWPTARSALDASGYNKSDRLEGEPAPER